MIIIMEAAVKEIDINDWSRKEIFDFFSAVESPCFSISFRLDVAPARRFAKEKNLSFYYCMIWLVTEAVNRVEAFRYTISDNRVMLLERREPSFTDMKPEAEYFHICTMDSCESIEEFCAAARERSHNQKGFISYADEKANLIFISCVPWLEVTGIANEGTPGKDDCIPRITWGKYVTEGDRLRMGFAVEVNHRFVDGADVGRFAAELEKLMQELS